MQQAILAVLCVFVTSKLFRETVCSASCMLLQYRKFLLLLSVVADFVICIYAFTISRVFLGFIFIILEICFLSCSFKFLYRFFIGLKNGECWHEFLSRIFSQSGSFVMELDKCCWSLILTF